MFLLWVIPSFHSGLRHPLYGMYVIAYIENLRIFSRPTRIHPMPLLPLASNALRPDFPLHSSRDKLCRALERSARRDIDLYQSEFPTAVYLAFSKPYKNFKLKKSRSYKRKSQSKFCPARYTTFKL